VALLAMAAMALALHFGPGGGSFDVLYMTMRRRLRNLPRVNRTFTLIHNFFKRDMFAFVFALFGVTGFAFAIPWCLAVGATIWLLAVFINVPALLGSRREDVLPPHLHPVPGNAEPDYISPQ
jgi:hypothetical protein